MKDLPSSNIPWYKKVYDSLIDKGKKRGLDKSKLEGYFEKHHIVPKCLGGTNEKENLVLLTAREHIVAHELLQRIYPNNFKIATAMVAMLMGSKPTSERNGLVSSKQAAYYRKMFSELKKGTKGHSQTEETRKLISKINTGRKFTPEQRERHSAKMKQRIITEEWKKNISKGMLGKKHPHKSQTYTPEGLKKMQDLCASRTGDKHPNSKRVKGPDGIIYPSVTECAQDIGVSRTTILSWINNKPDKGFTFI